MQCPLKFQTQGEGGRTSEDTHGMGQKFGERLVECIKERCAWYRVDAGACSVALIAGGVPAEAPSKD